MNNQNYAVTILLALSAIFLTLLIPGGSIENRDFSHINPSILLAFNIFLTVLGLGSFVLTVFTLTKSYLSYLLALLSGIAYFVVYAIDIYGIFPTSPTPMSLSLLLIELLGIIVAIPLVYLTGIHIMDKKMFSTNASLRLRKPFIVTLILLGTVIVIFATNAAMGGSQ